MDGTMASKFDSDRPAYRRSGRVNGLRFLPAALVAIAVAVAMAYCWFLAFDADLNYWLATPLMLSLPIAGAGYIAVAFGHCRNRFVAGAFGVLLALAFELGYFHFDMVHQHGPEAIWQFGRLPNYVANRMANDGLRVQNHVLPRNEMYNWFYAATELLVLSLLIGGAAVWPSLRGYCESCHRWMRSVAMHTESGVSSRIAKALQKCDWSTVPDDVRGGLRFGQPSAWLEFEYCPNVTRSADGCEAYLTLRENRGGTQHPETMMYQGLLARNELKALAERMPAFAFLRVSAPTPDGEEISGGRPIARHAGDVAAMEPVPPDAGSASLERAAKIEFLLAMIPISALLGGIGMIIWGAILRPWQDSSLDGYLLLFVGIAAAIAGGLVCWVNVDYFGVTYICRRLCHLLGQRAEALVTPADPEARFVDIVPRVQWHQLIPDKATDRGLFSIDARRGRLQFEGLKERYVIPTDAVISCAVEPMMPHTGNWNFFAVVLTVRYPPSAPASVTGGRRDDEWEIPLLPRPTRFVRYSTAYRRLLAESLRADIEEFLERAGRPSPAEK
jgi:hypothetical protein